MARVLVLDDSWVQVHFLGALLETAGHKVRSADRLMTARRLLRSFQPQLLLVNLVLWQGNGFSLAAALNRESLVTVLMTARQQPADRYWARVRGIDHVLARPQSPTDLLGAVETILQAHAGTDLAP